MNFDLVEWDPWPPEIVEGARPCPPSPPRTGKDGEVYGPELAARLEGLQQRAFEAILGAKAGARHLRVQMPVGAEKEFNGIVDLVGMKMYEFDEFTARARALTIAMQLSRSPSQATR